MTQNEPKTWIPLAKPVINQEMIEAVISALQDEKLVMGESVFKFEEEFAHYIGVKHAISVNSGTSGLMLVAEAYGLKPKDEVIVPSATFISTVNGAVKLGAKPVFAEISLRTYTIDVNDVIRKINEKTKMIIPVHLYGYPAELDPLLEAAEEIIIVEDAAQAHGAKYKGKRIGGVSHAAVFSFYPTKNLTVGGDGGMITTNDDELAEKLRKLRDVGRKSRYTHDLIGYTMRLNTVNAAIGRVQLKYLDRWNERRRHLAKIYDQNLSQLDEVKTPPPPDNDHLPVYHLYVIRVPSEHRNMLGAWLEENNIQALIHYPIPVHEQPAYSYLGYSHENLPLTKEWAKTVLSIPMFPELKDDQVKYISELIYEFYDKKLYLNRELARRGEKWLNKLM